MFAKPAQLLLTLTSPYARKCRMVAMEKAIDLPISIEPPHAAGSRVSALNPLVKIPALLLQDGEVVYDSRVIVQALELWQPQPPMLPADPHLRIQALRWEALADGVADAMVLVMMERQRPSERQDAAWIERQSTKVTAGLRAFESALAPQQFLLGGQLSLADLAVVSACGYVGLRGPELLAAAGPKLHDWLAWMHQRPSVAGTVPHVG
jgi:glutathione S-transferase